MPRLAALFLSSAVISQFALAANQDGPAEAAWPGPERVIIAEKLPFELPNGQMLVLFDHKVGSRRVRYEIDGVEHKPPVGVTLALPGPDHVVLVTCTRGKLLKEDYGQDSAEFEIEVLPRALRPAPAVAAPRPRRPAVPPPAPPPEPQAEEPPPPPPEGLRAPEAEVEERGLAPGSARRPVVARPQYRASAAAELPAPLAPHFVLAAEKRPFRLPNGQFFVLKDHKVGHNQVRYEVDGVEYKPAVGEPLDFPGGDFFVRVTCTRWKLEYNDEDSAEFLIECFAAE